uniref:Glutaredoxin domain-containing protein n=1 Tax=Kalanchoe fedtschenkoi TaxID=63787 RepID=A0A7N0UGW7_KALFE
MGCASSALLTPNDDDFSQLGSSAFGHHIVNLTSTTYGLLTLDSPNAHHRQPTTMSPPTPPPSFSDPEVINSWELMAGLDADSFRFTPSAPNSASATTPFLPRSKFRFAPDKENSNPNRIADIPIERLKKDLFLLKEKSAGATKQEDSCPPDAENRVVVYTTTLRGIRKTFEACNAVREAIQGLGVMVCERDVSMDRGFREELKELMNNGKKETEEAGRFTLPQVFIKGKHIGGAEEVLRLQEEGGLHELLDGLPRVPTTGHVCDGCGGIRFLPCFTCNGSCKMVVSAVNKKTQKQNVIVRCPDCNENGLVLCPICC